MEIKKIKGAAEAVLFASGEPVTVERIAQVLELDKPTAAKLLQNVMDEFNSEDGGVRIVRLDDAYQMCINSAYAPQVRETLDLRRNTPLSPASMEVLAIVAYNQPVTKAFVEQVRGVDCSGVLGSLMQKGLLEERGRLELPGRPLLYGTTADFLRCLSISSLEQLPPLQGKEGAETGEEEGGEEPMEESAKESEGT